VRRLTANESRIVGLIADGLGPTAIAQEKGTAVHTVKTQLTLVYLKLGLDDPSLHHYVRLGIYMNCELFRIGLQELGLSA